MDFTENKAFSEALSQIDSTSANKELEGKLKRYFGEMLVYKSSANSKFFSALSLPSYMRDWLVMRFSNSEGKIDKDEVAAYVKRTIPNKEQWNEYLVDLLHNNQPVRFLTKVKIDFDTATRNALFSLPDFGVPKKKGKARHIPDTGAPVSTFLHESPQFDRESAGRIPPNVGSTSAFL